MKLIVLAVVLAIGMGLGGGLAAFAVQSGLAGKIRSKIMARTPAATTGDVRTIAWRKIETTLLTVETADIPLGEVDGEGTGGAIDEFDGKVVVVTARGHIGYLDPAVGRLHYLDSEVSMGLKDLQSSKAWDNILFNRNWFRVHDILVQARGPNAADLYVSHHFYRDGAICNVINRIGLRTDGGTLSTVGEWQRVHEVNPCIDLEGVGYSFDGHMSGGRMFPDGNGKILLTVGDFGFGGKKARDELVMAGSANDLAKLLRLDPATGQTEIVAQGLRNAQGLTIDSKNRIWTTEHGAQGGDELNLIRQGGDYGWPKVTLGMEYGDNYIPRTPLAKNSVQGRHDDFIMPIMALLPSIAIGQIIELPNASKAFGLWSGDLLFSSLRAQSLFRIRLDGDRSVYAEPIKLDHRIRDLIQLKDGRLAMLTDERTVILMRDATDPSPANPIRVSGYDDVSAKESKVAGVGTDTWPRDSFRWKCGSCHTLDGKVGVGPPLNGIIGRKVASVDGYPYSPALANAGGSWDRDRLMAFVRNPDKAGFAGSAMPGIAGVDDEWMLRAILEYADKQ